MGKLIIIISLVGFFLIGNQLQTQEENYVKIGEIKIPDWVVDNMVIDDECNIYVLVKKNSQVFKFDREGKLLKNWQVKRASTTITIDKNNNIWVLSYPIKLPIKDNHLSEQLTEKVWIAKFDREGKLLFEIELPTEDKWGYIYDMAIIDNYLYLSDTDAKVIKKYEIKGEENKNIEKVSEIPIIPCCRRTGLGIWKGNLAVAKLTNFSVDVYDSNDRKIFSFGDKSVFWPCCNPVDVACDQEGNFYTLLKEPIGIKKFSPNGKFIMRINTSPISTSKISALYTPNGKRIINPKDLKYYPQYKTMRLLIVVDKKGEIIAINDGESEYIHLYGRR